MGLKEKRVVKEFQDEHYENYKKQVNEAAKFDVNMEVDWDSLAVEGSSHLYLECWPKVYFQPLIQALQLITADDMGAEALKESLKGIVIKNNSDCSNASRWCQFENGIITLDHKPTTNVDQIDDRAKALQSQLEDSL